MIEGIRHYIDPLSGDIVSTVDANGRWYRWFEQAPHRLDFAAGLRAQPIWDLVALLLLAGVALSCGTTHVDFEATFRYQSAERVKGSR